MSSCSSSSFPGFVIENTTIAVDFWPIKKYTHITHAFLTHAHTDHTQNLDANYTQHTIYCTEVIPSLLNKIINVFNQAHLQLSNLTSKGYKKAHDGSERHQGVTIQDTGH